jgi:hypothetical protein
MKNLFLSMHKGLLMPLLITAFAATISLFAIAPAEAQTKPSVGIGEPAKIGELPKGEFRATLEALPRQAQGRALELLQKGNVPIEDFVHLRVDRSGYLLFVDPDSDFEGAFAQGAEEITAPPSEISEANAFLLHSKPGATNILYLDFDGHNVQNSFWNSYNSGKSMHPMRPYSRDTDYDNFSQTEIDIIVDSWRQVAEDFAPFNIDVTTQEPVSFGSMVGHVLVTQPQDADGDFIYNCNCSGVAYVDVWGTPSGFPGLVFNTSLFGIVEAATHEFGHNLGLFHDGVTSGVSYYNGHGSGSVSWAPIMGVGYYKNVTQWSQGEYPGANNTEDDLLKISTKLGYQADDHEDGDLANATPLVIMNGADVSSLGRVSDPSWVTFENKGIIEHRNDIDLFSINVGAGTLDLTATPAHHEMYPGSTRVGSNLDIEVTLLNNFETVLQTNNPDYEINANIIYEVTAPGTYYLKVTGVGRGALVDGYTDYASIGQYHIHGTVPLPEAPVVEILAPADGTTGPGGTGFFFEATANDFKDGDISASISWSSDVDGDLGSGGNIVAILTGGTSGITHVVTASVIDSDSNTSTASITVHVDDTSMPVIHILVPADDTTQPGGTAFVFEATADDFKDGDISANISWSSDVDGDLGSGGNIVAMLTGGTSGITHVVTASVIDSDSNTYTTSITVHVDDTPLPVTLGLAAAFGALTPNAAFASTGVTTFLGDIGSATFAFAPAGTHIGTSYLAPAIIGAASDLFDAYADAEGRPAGTPLPGNISGLTVGPGVHSNAAAVGSTAGTKFTIDGEGNPNAVFIFQVGGALALGANFHMELINGAQAKNVFWQVHGAGGIGADSTFVGTLMANGAISSGANSIVNGRLLTKTGAIAVGDNDLDSGALTMSINGGVAAFTTVADPVISGFTSVVSSNTVTVTIDGGTSSAQEAQVVPSSGGTWTLTPENSLSDGDHTIVATVTDGSTSTFTQILTVDTQPFATVPLGLAEGFGALTPNGAFASIGATTFLGDIGSATFAFAPAGTHIGTSYLVPAFAGAAGNLIDAYADAEGRPAGTPLPGNISGLTVGPGVHSNPAAVSSTAATDFFIDGQDNPDAVFVFQVGGALSVGANFEMLLINGAQAKNVFWQVNGGGSIGADSTFVGTMLANGAISSGTNSVINGRLLTKTGAIAMGANDLDSGALTVSINGGAVASTTVLKPVISGFTSSPNTVAVTIDGGTPQVVPTAGGAWTLTPVNALSESDHTIVATVTDGAVTSTFTQVLTVDTQPLAPVPLGRAAPFGALTPNGAFASTGVTKFLGDIGSATFAFAPAGEHIGGSYLAPAIIGAASDLFDAYADAEGRPAGTPLPGNISGLTVGPGVHSNAAAVGSTAATVFFIDGQDNPDAVFIFQVGGALALGANFDMELINGAQAKNVFWQVNGAGTIGADSTFIGTMLANGAISSGANNIVNGRLLTKTGAIAVGGNDLDSR